MRVLGLLLSACVFPCMMASFGLWQRNEPAGVALMILCGVCCVGGIACLAVDGARRKRATDRAESAKAQAAALAADRESLRRTRAALAQGCPKCHGRCFYCGAELLTALPIDTHADAAART